MPDTLCTHCESPATYFRDPKTGKASKSHRFCSRCWEDALRRAGRNALQDDTYANLRKGVTKLG